MSQFMPYYGRMVKCAVCGSVKKHGWQHTSTRRLLCTYCLSCAVEHSLYAAQYLQTALESAGVAVFSPLSESRTDDLENVTPLKENHI